jgi:hypothetical protein
MELFLLLSIGMSIVAFISIALNQVPPPPLSVTDQNLEPVFPLESYLLTTEKMNILKLNDEVLLQDFESNEHQDYPLVQDKPSLSEKEGQPVLLKI